MMTDQSPARTMWEDRYSIDGYLFGTEPNDFLRDNLGALGSGIVLCLAEGEGRNATFLARQGFDVHSVDLTESGVAKTLRLAADNGVTVHAQVGDLATHDIGVNRWDAIVSIFAHMPPEIRRGLHRRVVTALKPGGVILLEAYTPAQIGRGTGGPQAAEMTMSLATLTDELDGLDVVHAIELVRNVVEGPGHTGDGAVVQYIARKPV
jgi:SAM-dependent methyltransferase